mmetsp:Transcript_29055/g.40125  ORF Transcript_29055/g.40125 Transcript_29055/m.40125 type:complete len:274 (+) Transcript_29055:40-861(+)|eukprot:CAMPEP_0196593822 /NCGR_PEP_ID=MMETSP1081-20130531/76672_1 /TAXON_ID=36882 /ORGANISM="Pyramimonas amylifera, Strain CCMP720" /LENGTH=273 /DNA_ID=CAMNT_0041917921 /DNA_START=293 /DNA_END=1114 /DNA_ORIENTATION=+
MFSSTLIPENKFRAEYSSEGIRRSGTEVYMRTSQDTFCEINNFESIHAREFVVGLETKTEELGATVRSLPPHSQPAQECRFGAPPVPAPASLNRDVLRWLQSLDLSHSVRNIRRDTSNGFLIAEICSRYFPVEIQMHSFENGSKTVIKVDNWRQLKEFFKKNELKVADPIVEGTIKGLHGAAVELVELLYEMFTGKRVQRMLEMEPEEDDSANTGSRRIRPKASDQPVNVLPGLTPGSKVMNKALPSAPAIQFGTVRLTHVENMAPVRQRGAL